MSTLRIFRGALAVTLLSLGLAQPSACSSSSTNEGPSAGTSGSDGGPTGGTGGSGGTSGGAAGSGGVAGSGGAAGSGGTAGSDGAAGSGGVAGSDGGCPPSCDDNNACTTDTCTAGNCVFTKAIDGTSCPTGVCKAGACVACGGEGEPCCAASACDDVSGACGWSCKLACDPVGLCLTPLAVNCPKPVLDYNYEYISQSCGYTSPCKPGEVVTITLKNPLGKATWDARVRLIAGEAGKGAVQYPASTAVAIVDTCVQPGYSYDFKFTAKNNGTGCSVQYYYTTVLGGADFGNGTSTITKYISVEVCPPDGG